MNQKLTFKNLPAAKQDRIILEAVREFATHGYRKASLNTLVKRLGIAKGSIYQYFHNKEALYLFIFERFTKLVKESLHESVNIDSGDSFFSQIQQTLQAGINFIDQHPEYYQIYLRLQMEQEAPHREELLQKVRLFSKEYFGTLCQQAKDSGIIRQNLSCATVIFFVESILERFLQAHASRQNQAGYEINDFPGPKTEQQLLDTITILQNGLCP